MQQPNRVASLLLSPRDHTGQHSMPDIELNIAGKGGKVMEQSLSSGSLQFRGVESHMDNKNARQNDIWVQACYVGAKSRAQIIAKTDAEALLPGKVAFEQMLKKFV